jgi:hypothetical protein
MRKLLLAGLAALALGGTGCSFTGMPGGYTRSTAPVKVNERKYLDLRGALHVHTAHSHDSRGTIDDLLPLAKDIGLDFLCITDHDNRKAAEWEGLHDGILVIAGEECAPRGGHTGAYGIRNTYPRGMDPQALIDAVRAEGGFSVINHPFGKGGRDTIDAAGFDGLEVYNFGMEFNQKTAGLVFKMLFWFPWDQYNAAASCIKRPVRELELWDRLTQERPVVGIGTVDAHQKAILPRYRHSLWAASTHVLAEKLDEPSVIAALKAGHCYIALEKDASATGFLYTGRSGGKTALMGETLALDRAATLNVTLPKKAGITILKDGKKHHAATARSLELAVTEPGVYRVEAELDGNPWVYSNPIYIQKQ